MDDINRKRKVLLVDDDEIQLVVTSRMLQNDYEIFIAKSGKEALEHFCRGPIPNLVLLDILMPNMDGWEAYSKIRAISLLANIPIAFLTSMEGEDEKKRALEMGAADYLIRPMEKEELLERIKKIMDNYKTN